MSVTRGVGCALLLSLLLPFSARGAAESVPVRTVSSHAESALDTELSQRLASAGFTGTIESTLE